MSILFRDRPPVTAVRSGNLPNGLDELAASIRNLRGNAGIFVDGDTAMRHDAVWACVTQIAQDVSMMPVDVVRYQNGKRFEVSPTPQIVASPSVFTAAMDWRYQVMVSLLMDGNAWGLVTQSTGDSRYPTRIEIQAAADVSLYPDGKGGFQFEVRHVNHDLWPVGDLWHLPAYTMPGSMVGLSPIAYHARSVGHGLAAEQFGAQFFADGGHPTAIISPKTAPTQDQVKALKERITQILRGNREPLVLPQDTTYQQIQISPNDSQFLETMRYSVEQIARVYGCDPAEIGASTGGSSVTYANRSDADLARYKRRQFWITKMSLALTALLPRPQVVKLNPSALLMMTATERHQLHRIRLNSKTVTVNEVRSLEDEPPFPAAEFDEPGIPATAPQPVEVT